MPPGHGVTVQSNLTCEQLQARIQPGTTTLTTTSTASTVPVGMNFGGSNAAVGLWAAGLLAGVIVDHRGHGDVPVSAR